MSPAKTVAWVAPEVNAYAGDKGTTYYVNVTFADEESGSLGKRDQAQAEELRKMLELLKGTVAEFGLEDSGRKNKAGHTAWKIKSFPGYEPAPYSGGGGGGKREYVPRFTDTEAGFALSDERVDRRRAAELAVQVVVASQPQVVDLEGIVGLAGTIYTFLRETSGSGDPSPEASASTGKTKPHPLVTPDPDPSSAAVSAYPRGQVAGTVAGNGGGTSGEVGSVTGKDGAASPEHTHEPDPAAEARMGRRPCKVCGVWVRG